MTHYLYVGQRSTQKRAGGVSILAIDGESGKMCKVTDVTLGNATYGVFTRDGKYFYSSCEDAAFGKPGSNGGLVAFKVLPEGKIERLNTVATQFGSACHVSLAPDEKSIVWADYGSATVGYAPILPDGRLGTPCKSVQHFGSGPDKTRQEKAHAHCARISPDGKYLAVCDLGMDEVKVYDYAARGVSLTELKDRTFHTRPAGGGPRHIIFHPNGKLAFVVFELMNLCASYRYEDGAFTHIQTVPIIPGNFTAFSKAAAILLSQDGRTLFCTNRGHDSLAVIQLDPETGALALKKIISLGSSFPWDLEFLPGEKIVAIAFEKEGRVRSFAWDAKYTTLTPLDSAEGYNPTFCLKVSPPL